ncbi:MAG: lysozyme [Pseudomonadota bacterium]
MVRVIIIAALVALNIGLWIIDRGGGPSWITGFLPAWIGSDSAFIDDGEVRAAREGSDNLTLPSDDSIIDQNSDEKSAVQVSDTDTNLSSTVSDAGVDEVRRENSRLRINESGLAIIKEAEGLRLEAYEAGGRTYIGYGHQRRPSDPKSITEAQADAFLREDVKIAEKAVSNLLKERANENEFSAMVSLAYNLGGGNFRRSDVPKKFNEGDKKGAADAFRNHNTAGGIIVPKLTERREKERALFLTPVE